MSLANKYRPQTFDTIIGQDHITSILKAKVASPTDSHSNFLLFGPRGTGKTSAARVLAKAINCEQLDNGNPCTICASCQLIQSGTTLDYIEIDAASHTGVDNIREEILDKLAYSPTTLKKKIYVIDEVHMLSKGAFNALLKTIEEPKDTVAFILATTEIHKVPETIISRCQVFNFKKIPDKEMIINLEKICKQEMISYEPHALAMIARIAEGCARDANKYLDQVSILGTISEAHVSRFLGIASEGRIQNFLHSLKEKNTNDVFATIQSLQQEGIDFHHFTKQILAYIDEHRQEDTDFLFTISEVFTTIISTLRHYPYPTMVYKIHLHRFLGGETLIPQTTQAQPVIQPQQTAPTTEITPPPTSTLLTQVLAKIEKASLQGALKDYLVLEVRDDGSVHGIIINKLTHTLLQKQENFIIIEQAISAVLGKQIRFTMAFIPKEEYFEKLQNNLF